jgi:hypothetical protein
MAFLLIILRIANFTTRIVSWNKNVSASTHLWITPHTSRHIWIPCVLLLLRTMPTKPLRRHRRTMVVESPVQSPMSTFEESRIRSTSFLCGRSRFLATSPRRSRQEVPYHGYGGQRSNNSSSSSNSRRSTSTRTAYQKTEKQ